jgi:acyl-CoA thioesterase
MIGSTDNDNNLAKSVAEGMYALDNAARSLGIVIDEAGPHYSRVSVVVREDMLNSHSICHGGIIFTLADTAFAYASNSGNASTLALSCSINYAEAVPLGEKLSAIARKTFRKNRTGVYDVEVTNSKGDVVALFRGNSYQMKAQSVPGLNERLDAEKT